MDKKNDSLLFDGGRWKLYRYTLDPSQAHWLYSPDGGIHWMSPGKDELTEVHDELARRLLAERAEQEKLDEHNDRAEAEPFYAVVERVNAHSEQLNVVGSTFIPEVRGRLSTLEAAYGQLGKVEMRHAELERRIAELDKNLAREIEQRTLETRESRRNHAVYERVQAELIEELEALKTKVASLSGTQPDQAAPPEAAPGATLRWDRIQGIMVDDRDKIALDLSDYFEDGNMSRKDHDLLEKLADLWSAWGPEGYLRDRLYNAAAANPDAFRFENFGGWFRQLRSELLAKPWKEGV